MTLSDLSPAAHAFAVQWDAARTLAPARRLVLPHLVLAAAGGAPLSRAAQALALSAGRPGLDALTVAEDEVEDARQVGEARTSDVVASSTERLGRHGGRRAATRSESASHTRARARDGITLSSRYYKIAHDLEEIAATTRVRTRGLVMAWDEAAAAVDYAYAMTPDGRDVHGHPWMPTLGGLRPALPFDDAYRRLGREPGGADAQLVLLAIAGEAGRQALVVDWDVLVCHTGLSDVHVHDAATLLAARGWVTREPWSVRDQLHPRVLRVAFDRGPRVFRGPAAV